MRAVQNRIGRPEQCAFLRTLRLYLFSYPDSLIHFVRSASLLSRRSRLQDWSSLSSYHSRRVAFSVRYALYTWRVVQGLDRRLRPHSHCKPRRAEQSRTEPNGTGPSLTERVQWLMFFSHKALINYKPATLFFFSKMGFLRVHSYWDISVVEQVKRRLRCFLWCKF
jgi:hypothetical protein